MHRRLLLILLLAAPIAANAQAADSAQAVPLIQDNSFLVEEAYNQEAGVVQHVVTYERTHGSNGFDAAFTQEWPIKSIRHQLSYDVPFRKTGSDSGVGDISINYRYQLAGDGSSKLAVSPRISLILPTGDWKRGHGDGAAGFFANLPVSYVVSPVVSIHSNAGVSFTSEARNAVGERAGISGWRLAQSVIYTASRAVQPMFEAIYSSGTEVTGDNRTARSEEFFLAPGVRAAFNFASGLQIVPGISVPIGIGPSNNERGVFLYLSVEHSFSR